MTGYAIYARKSANSDISKQIAFILSSIDRLCRSERIKRGILLKKSVASPLKMCLNSK
jgi:hypothetical protein